MTIDTCWKVLAVTTSEPTRAVWSAMGVSESCDPKMLDNRDSLSVYMKVSRQPATTMWCEHWIPLQHVKTAWLVPRWHGKGGGGGGTCRPCHLRMVQRHPWKSGDPETWQSHTDETHACIACKCDSLAKCLPVPAFLGYEEGGAGTLWCVAGMRSSCSRHILCQDSAGSLQGMSEDSILIDPLDRDLFPGVVF